eukprot:TRINITY_DN1099_c0_g1_i1.p1 TRINITY_DN1099_c0_g1~~TRINITY_DN1099_c0_g1_i1.p1  ORF type:complete len:247 (+),score=47.24 TRINITY_DN1099_c0_g1_i1:33-773(+)
MRFDQLTLKVPDVEGTTKFYCDVLGMKDTGKGLGYDAGGLKLVLIEGDEKRSSTGKDAYWKIGITVKDLDAVVKIVREAGVEVSQPAQFKDIGYLCHLRDPAGLGIELMQQGFEGHAKPAGTLSEQATLAHITLRVADLDKARCMCETDLGMRLISVQPVPRYNFTLYFYTWSEEALPDSDLKAVSNREWLWARPYALLEIQHLEKATPADIRVTPPSEAGPVSIHCCDSANPAKTHVLTNSDIDL